MRVSGFLFFFLFIIFYTYTNTRESKIYIIETNIYTNNGNNTHIFIFKELPKCITCLYCNSAVDPMHRIISHYLYRLFALIRNFAQVRSPTGVATRRIYITTIGALITQTGYHTRNNIILRRILRKKIIKAKNRIVCCIRKSHWQIRLDYLHSDL